MAEETNDIVRLVYDAGNSEEVIRLVTRAIQGQNDALDEATKSFKQFNNYAEATELVLKAISDVGEKAVAVIKKTDEGFKLVNSTVSQSVKKFEAAVAASEEVSFAQKELAAQLNRTAEAARNAAIDQYIRELEEADIAAKRLLSDQERLSAILASTKEAAFIRDANAERREEITLDNKIREALLTINNEIEKGIQLENERAAAIKRSAAEARISATIAGRVNPEGRLNNFTISPASPTQDLEEKRAAIAANSARIQQDIQNFLEKLNSSHRKAADEARRASNEVLISWQSIARFFATHLIYNAVFQIINAFERGAKTAAQFERSISEIRTLSQDSQIATGEWVVQLRALSDKFGNNLADVASAAYEALSNQIVNATATSKFLNDALTFAQVTISSAEDSVNLLSSALNSYHLQAEDSARISAIFFKTIDLGRVRASEMANTIGRILPLSAQLGISLEETAASLTVLTRQGLKYNEAFTLISNLEQKLIKPTDAMKELFKQWGVETGQAAIAAFGFEGVLKRLEEAAGGNIAEFGELFSNIRAIRGAIGLTGSAFKEFGKDLNALKNPIDSYNKAIDETSQSTGRKFEIELQKIRNAFTVTFGQNIVENIINITDKFGGLANTVGEVGKAAVAFGTAIAVAKAASIANNIVVAASVEALRLQAAGFSNVTTGALLSTSAINTLGVAVRRFLPIAIAFAAIEIGVKIKEQQEEVAKARENGEAEAAKLNEKSRRNLITRLEKETTATKENINQRFQAILTFETNANKVLTRLSEFQIEKFKQIEREGRDVFDVIIKNLSDGVSKTESLITEANNKIKKSQEDYTKFLQVEEEKSFERQLKVADAKEQQALVQQRITKLQQDAVKFAKEGDQEAAQRALNQALGFRDQQFDQQLQAFKELKKLKQELRDFDLHSINIERSLSDSQEIRNTRGQIAITGKNKAIRESIRALQEQKATDDGEGQRLERSNKRAEIVDKIRQLEEKIGGAGLNEAQFKLRLDEQSLQFKQTEKEIADLLAKSAQDQAEAKAKELQLQRQNLETIKTQLEIASKIKVTDAKGNLKFKSVSDIRTQFDSINNALLAAGLQSQDIILQLQKQEQALEVEFAIESAKKRIEQEERVTAAKKQQLEKRSEDLKTGIIKDEDNISQSLNKVTGIAEEIVKNSTRGLTGPKIDSEQTRVLNEALENLKKAVGDRNFQQIGEQIGKILGNTPFNADDIVARGKSLRDLAGLLDLYAERVRKAFTEENNLKLQQNIINQQLINLDQQSKDLIQQLNSEFRQLDVNINFSTQNLITNLQRIQDAAKGLNNGIQVPTQFKADGGSIFAPRGTDTIPAMLSPGEYVVDAENTRRFLPQLISMSRGIQPRYFSEGGQVSFGDINVSGVSYTGDPQTDGRILGRVLQNEIRRKRINLHE